MDWLLNCQSRRESDSPADRKDWIVENTLNHVSAGRMTGSRIVSSFGNLLPE